MNARIMCLSLTLAALSPPTLAADGLLPPAAAALWPQWQARIAVQSSSAAPINLSQLLIEGNALQRGLQGGAVLGDYYFANPFFGSFRASGGLLVGLQGGAPLTLAPAGPRLSLAVSSGDAFAPLASAESPGTATYVGLGFTGAAWRGSLAVTADLGLVAEHPGSAGGVGRAIFGNQGMENALREMRLSPVLQLGVRYTF